MLEKIKYYGLKTAVVVMAVLIIIQIINLLADGEQKTEQTPEHFTASEIEVEPVSQVTPLPTKAPFVLTNYDKIRVVITNKENGSIYHKDGEVFDEDAGYRGKIEVIETGNGYVVINELPLEEYLYSVVPSEMPANYPMEALKAQAICARTYAYLHISSPAYPQWNAHVDDTTAFQVYHSVEEQESTTQAVNETQSVVLLAPGGEGLAETYYYSTSCGYGSDARVWRTKFSDQYPYIKSKHINKGSLMTSVEQTMAVSSQKLYYKGTDLKNHELFEHYIGEVHELDLESDESWYRWTYTVEDTDLKTMLKNLQKRYEANEELILTLVGNKYVSKPIKELETLVDIVVDKRGNGGVADELLIITEKNVYKVITELNIRYVLNDGSTKVIRQDGSKVSMPNLLPSAFFVLNNIYESGEVVGYEIAGGGFGHGAGMSQNAAKAMALEGLTAEEILEFFFEDCTLANSEEKGK